MSPDDSGGRRQNQGRQAGWFLCSAAEISKARTGAGRSQLLLQILQNRLLFGSPVSKGRVGEKKSRGEGQAPSFLMRNTKKERINVPLQVSRCSPDVKSQGQGQGRGG